MEEIKPQGMLVSIEIKGNTDISYMPKLFALAQEAGLEIKFQGSNADKKSNLNWLDFYFILWLTLFNIGYIIVNVERIYKTQWKGREVYERK